MKIIVPNGIYVRTYAGITDFSGFSATIILESKESQWVECLGYCFLLSKV